MAHPVLVSAAPPATQNSLVSRAQRGDVDALGALYDAHAPALCTLAVRLLGNDADAEDCVHDVFLGLPEALQRYEERGTLDSWLKRITARVALNRLRSTRRRAEESPAHEPRGRDGRGTLDAIAIREAVAALPDTLRAVFVLKEIEGFSHEEIARLLGITRGNSEVRLHRAIRALRVALGT
jgi:RNA polymerase sigma-70 factor (ECF subfamily)